MRRGRTSGLLLALAVGAVAMTGCREKVRTEIIVGIATDLMAPAPLTSVHLTVTRLPQADVGEQDLPISGTINNVYELPGTYALYSPAGTPDRVRIVLTATDNASKLLVQRSAVLSLVPQKTLFVRLGVVSACVGKLDCPTGDTCIDGRCAPETIDSSRLPTYQPGMEKEVSCAGVGAANYVDTSTKVALTVTGTTCPDKGVCEEGVCLDALEGSFTPTKGSPLVARAGAAQIGAGLIVLDGGSVLSVGGTGANNTPVLASAETYDPASGRFTATGNLGTARVYFGEAKLADGRVLVAGGINEAGVALASAEIYDPATRTFAPTAAPMTTGRVFPSLARLADGRILVVGGTNNIKSYAQGLVMYQNSIVNAEIYDPVTKTFTATEGSLATGRAYAHVTALPDGGAVVICGANNDVGAVLTLERFDAARGTFAAATPSTLPAGTTTCDSKMAELRDGSLLITTGPGDLSWLYDPMAGTFTSAGSHPSPRGTFAAVLADGRALFAGSTTGMTASKQAYLFDPASRSFAFVKGELNGALADLMGAPLANGDALIVGAGVATAEIFHPGSVTASTGSGGTGGSSGVGGARAGGIGGAGGPGGAGAGGRVGANGGAPGTTGVAGAAASTGGTTATGGTGGQPGIAGAGGLPTVGTGGLGGGPIGPGGSGGLIGGLGGTIGMTGVGGAIAASGGSGGTPIGSGGTPIGSGGTPIGSGGTGGSGGAIAASGGSGGTSIGTGGNLATNGDFSAGMNGWSTRVFATGTFSGYPKLTVQPEPGCLSNRVANPYFQFDVPGGAAGALEQTIVLPTTPVVLTLSVWGGADPVDFTVSIIDSGSNEHVLETFTPPSLQTSGGGCLAAGAQPVSKRYTFDQWNGPVTLRFQATASGANGTIVGIDDIVAN